MQNDKEKKREKRLGWAEYVLAVPGASLLVAAAVSIVYLVLTGWCAQLECVTSQYNFIARSIVFAAKTGFVLLIAYGLVILLRRLKKR